MGFLKGAFKAGIAAKAAQMIKREASKPENQRKARDMFAKVTNRGQGKPRH